MRRWAVASELATAPSKAILCRASRSMKKFAVEPVPTPTMLFSSSLGRMKSMAAWATACLSWSWVMLGVRMEECRGRGL
ncbi:hypothetical protein D3C81_1888860 [compost metagenome]